MEPIEFNRDIRPILSLCFTCHGPAAGDGVAGLRLDSFEGATKKLEDGKQAVVPGNPDASELVRRVEATDETILMPPPSSHKVLSAADKANLRRWIQEGAKYKPHWAFVEPVRPPLPVVKNSKWVRNPIDRFVLARLENSGLKPEPEAERGKLLRRVSLDLTGIPPSPAELDAFLSDKGSRAYEKAVDRLLASPRYGERMAMDWMDYARYADSNGYQADYERYQWRWRDWVIDAFNRNLPYDQFTVWQIAGDLLPNATMEQKLATGFNRNHRINTEGGVIAEEWRVENVIDRVETTSAIWLGLTSGCARCHDHKYDPLTQRDFYRMFAFYNNVPETGSGEERPINHPPTLKTPTAAQSAEMARLTALIEKNIKWMSGRAAASQAKSSNWALAPEKPLRTSGQLNQVRLSATSGLTTEGKVQFEPGRATGSAAFSDGGFVDLGDAGAAFEKDTPFSYGGWVKPANGEGAPFARMDSGNAFRGWECSLVGGRPQAHLINRWPENALKIAAKETIPNGKWTHLFFTYDGGMKAKGFRMYVNGKAVETNVENDRLSETIKTGVSTKLGRRTNSEQFAGSVDGFAWCDAEMTAAEVAVLAAAHPARPLLAIPKEKRSKEQNEEIARLWSLDNDKVFAKTATETETAQEDRRKLDMSIPTTMVLEEMPKPRDCYVLERGQYDKHGEKVDAGLPTWLPNMPTGVPNNRLGFAKWIVSAENPLTARVTANRLWERFFGNGIVSTVEDFGTRAEYPSHPELLDWLGTELVRLKWDLKAFIKEIVMSAAYRQSSAISAEKLEKDPLNRLISRGPRFRLPGEVIRDQALFVSGLLTEKLGGPSVYPYMPEAVWDETNFYGNLRNYKRASDSNLYRRSLYTIWKRTAAPPNMLLFDVPAREACRVRRARTDTPLQALTLMNDETFVEASRVLAQKMMELGGSTPESRITYAFRRVLSRDPSKAELKVLTANLAVRTDRYRKDPKAARKLLIAGDAPLNLGLDQAELAAYTLTASALLNLDETVTKE